MSNPQALHFRGSRVSSAQARHPIELRERPEWFTDQRRACNPAYGKDHLFTSDDLKERNEAARICRRRCPFVSQCLAWATANGETNHVWGGRNFSRKTEHKPAARPEPAQTAPDAPGDCPHCGRKLTLDGRCTQTACSCPKCHRLLSVEGRRCRRTTCYAPRADPSRGERTATLERQVRELWEQDLPDGVIALRLDRNVGSISKVRKRLDLPAKFGPAGKRLAVPA